MSAKKPPLPSTIQETPPPPVGGAVPGLRLKMISAKYGRKVNVQMIDPKRSYESMEVELVLWTDCEAGIPEAEAIRQLQALVEKSVTEQISAKVLQLREYAKFAGDTPMKAIELAFREHLIDVVDNITNEEIAGGWEIFKAKLDLAAAQLAAR